MNRNKYTVGRILYIIVLSIIIALALCYIKAVIFYDSERNEGLLPVKIKNENIKTDNVSESFDANPKRAIKEASSTEIENINIEPMAEFSGMSAKEILALRKEAVMTSPVFKYRTDYKPNSEVFNIKDGLQWISAHEISCNELPNPNVGRGPSRESLGILNPELMYYILVPSRRHAKHNISCTKADYLAPYRAYYNRGTNTITALVDYSSLIKKYEGVFDNVFGSNVFADANARDMGYKYGYADTVENVSFETDKFTTSPIVTRGYYHQGYACMLEEGCNNYSPAESGYFFRLTKLPARIHIKLWAENPKNPVHQAADLNYEMIFE